MRKSKLTYYPWLARHMNWNMIATFIWRGNMIATNSNKCLYLILVVLITFSMVGRPMILTVRKNSFETESNIDWNAWPYLLLSFCSGLVWSLTSLYWICFSWHVFHEYFLTSSNFPDGRDLPRYLENCLEPCLDFAVCL